MCCDNAISGQSATVHWDSGASLKGERVEVDRRRTRRDRGLCCLIKVTNADQARPADPLGTPALGTFPVPPHPTSSSCPSQVPGRTGYNCELARPLTMWVKARGGRLIPTNMDYGETWVIQGAILMTLRMGGTRTRWARTVITAGDGPVKTVLRRPTLATSTRMNRDDSLHLTMHNLTTK